MAQTVKNPPAMPETWIWSRGWEDNAGKGNGYPLLYSCLENPMDRGAWRAIQSMGSPRVGHDWATNTSALSGLFEALHNARFFFFKLFSWFLEKQFFTSILRNLRYGIWRRMKTAQILYLVVVFNESFINESFTIIGISLANLGTPFLVTKLAEQWLVPLVATTII